MKKIVTLTAILGSLWWLQMPAMLMAQRWIVHTIPNIPGDSVNDILVDHYGCIWVGTEQGLARFDGSWVSFCRQLGGDTREIRCLKMDASGIVWIGTNTGLVKIDPASDLNDPANWTTYTTTNTDSGLVSNRIQAIAFDGYGHIWIGTDSLGVCSANIWRHTEHPPDDVLRVPQNWVHHSAPSALKDNRIRTLEADTANNIWVSNAAGIDIFDANNQIWINDFTFCDSNGVPVSPAKPIVQTIFRDSQGRLWLGTQGHGLYKAAVGNLHSTDEYYDHSNTRSGLVSNRIWKLTEDREGVLWIAHNNDDGISLVNGRDNLKKPSNWRQMTSHDGLATNRVISLAVDGEQNIWFGHQMQRGISQLDRSWLAFLTGTNSSTNYINHLFLDSSRTLWVATDAGAIWQNIDANLWLDQCFTQSLTRQNGLSGTRVFAVFQDSRDFIWLGTDRGIDIIARTAIDASPQIKDHYCSGQMINCFAEDQRHNIWIGTNIGLYSVHVDSVRNGTECWHVISGDSAQGLVSDEIHALLVDSQGILWIGTNRGIVRFDHQHWQRFQQNDQMVNINIKAIAEDAAHRLWFATENGLLQIDPRSDLSDAQNWKRYSTDDGLASNYITAICERQKGELWCGTALGATRLDQCESTDKSTFRATTFNLSTGLSTNFIWTLVADTSNGDIWLGTRGGGISRYRPQHAAPQTYLDTKFNAVTANLIEFRFHGADDATPAGELIYQYRLVTDSDETTSWQETSSQFVTLFLEDADRPRKYMFQVRAIDRDGNVDPSPDQTEFVKLDARAGGAVELSTDDVHIRLLLPPGLLQAHHNIHITPLPRYQLSDTATAIIGIEISGLPEHLDHAKPVTLSISFFDQPAIPREQLAIFQETKDSLPIGGTPQLFNGRLSIATVIFESGIYVVRSTAIKTVSPKPFNLNLQPRIFSPAGNGRGHGDRTTISFFLEQESNVSIKIYNSSGRLTKAIKPSSQLQRGYNAVDWDGTDDSGKICSSGLYIVTVADDRRIHQKTVVILNKF